ncbi:ComEC/Rec2 family competence protein [Veillonella sp.]
MSCGLGVASYVHVNHEINHYVGHTKFYISQEGEYALLVDSPVETTVIEEKKYKTFSAMLLGLEPHKDTAKGLHIKADGHIKVTIEEKSSPIHMGDTIIVNGTPKKLYLTEERGTIDRRNKAIRNEEMASIFEGTYKIVDIHTLQPYKLVSYIGYYQQYLYIIGHMRSTIETLMQRYLSDKIKWLGVSLVLGGHYGELGEDVLWQFGYTGIIHILSISGSHIALLFSIVYGFCRLCTIKKRYAMIGGIVLSVFYCILVGLSAPVVRSTIMGIWLALAYIKGRMYTAKQGLAITAILFLLYDPLLLLDVSFQLSFGATYGLLLFGMPLYRWITCLPPIVKAPLVLCISAQLLLIPFQLYYFHYLSLASLLAAIIITPLLDIAIVMLFGCTIISLFIPMGILWKLIEIILSICLYVNAHLANSSICLWWIGTISTTLGLLYYVCIGLLYINLVSLKLLYRTFTKGIIVLGIGIIAIAYSGIVYKNETILHIVPMKQSNTMIIVKPYEKVATVYIDTPDNIPMKASEIRVRNGLQSFGIPLKNVHVKRFQSSGKNIVLYKNNSSSVMVYNRQNGEKKLQLKDIKDTILITSQSYMVNQILALQPEYPVLVSMPRGAMRDIDPDTENIHLWGYQYIPDYRL